MDIKIDDIAKLANVSRGTVDRVLHNRGRVSEKTAAKVRKIVQEMNYQPNSLGRAFAMSQKKLKLGVLLTYKERQFGDQIMSGIGAGAELAEQIGFEVLIRAVESPTVETCMEVLREFAEEGVSGIAMRGLAYPQIEAEVQKMRTNGIKIVTFNSDMVPSARDCFVGQDHQNSGRCAAFLMQEICRFPGNILILGVDTFHQASMNRIESFCEVMRESQLISPNTQIYYAEGKNQLSYKITCNYLKTNEAVRGIFVSGAGLCGACQAVEENGLIGKIKIVGFDATDVNAVYLKKGTVQFLIDQDPYQQGYLPLKLLTDSIFQGRSIEKDYYDTGISIKTKYNL